MVGRVLMVDDDDNVLRAFQRILRNAPYEILVANSATRALALLEAQHVDVVVADQFMRGMSGTQLLTHLREVVPGAVRILLTGQPRLDLAIDAINSGEIFRFLTKPCPGTLLKKAIAEAFRFQRDQAQGQALLKTLNDTVESLDTDFLHVDPAVEEAPEVLTVSVKNK